MPALSLVLLVVFFGAWAILDARWTWNLARQVAATISEYGGKDLDARHLASSDGAVYAFVQKARAAMPRDRVRVFVAGDVAYLRGRAAYHLYPHNVYNEPEHGAIPPAAAMRPGDWIVVLQKKGVQYDRTNRSLRWEGSQSVAADLVLFEGGYALLRVV